MSRPAFHCGSCLRHVFGEPVGVTPSGKSLCATREAKMVKHKTSEKAVRKRARAAAKAYRRGNVPPWAMS